MQVALSVEKRGNYLVLGGEVGGAFNDEFLGVGNHNLLQLSYRQYLYGKTMLSVRLDEETEARLVDILAHEKTDKSEIFDG